MIGNIWLYSTLTIATIFSASVAYKAYSDIQEAKDIQQSFEIISQIKQRVAKEYNKSPEDVTRDEVIAYLPKGPNWEKVLLVSRSSGNTLINSDALLNADGEFELDEDEKVKLLALNAKLKEYGIEQTQETSSNKVTFKMGMQEKNFSYKDNVIAEKVTKTIEILYLNKNSLDTEFTKIIQNNTPYNYIYHDLKKTDTEKPSTSEVKLRKEVYFKKRIKQRLISSKNSRDIEIYDLIKDKL